MLEAMSPRRNMRLEPLIPAEQDTPPTAYVLVGPTAAGKTAVAHTIAAASGAAILSADSMLVYRGMDIGTAKPTSAERRLVPYFGVDVVSPSESFSVAMFLNCAREAWRFCVLHKRPLLVVGGTGLYIKCLTEGLAPAPGPDPEVRARAEQILAAEGIEGLYRVLEATDPQRARQIKDRNNPRRLVRALELACRNAPAPVGWSKRPSEPMVGLRWPPMVLAERIADRVRWMYETGLLDETERLLKGPAWSETARKAIGYAEAAAVLQGVMTLEEAIALTIRRTRQLAKRQMTWFRHQAFVHWIEGEPGETTESLAQRVAAAWSVYGRAHLHI